MNSDVKAWLTVDDTGIDYPIVQSINNVKYVNCDVFGNYSLSGSVFLDYRCKGDFTGNYSILYGHHMEGGAMFGDLLKYEQKSFFDSHRRGTLITPGKAYSLELFAYLSVDAYDEIFDPEVDKSGMEKRLEHIRLFALHYVDIGVTSSDKIIMLSTCASSSTNGRGVAVGRLTDING